MLTLAMDAATSTGTVALLDGERVIASAAHGLKDQHADHFLPMVQRVLAEAHVAPAQLGRVVCGHGPGSFTSLRIVAATAKGLVAGATLRGGSPLALATVSSLALVVAAGPTAPGRWIAVLDAIRGERFVQTCEVDAEGFVRTLDAPRRIAAADVVAEAERLGATPIGPLESIVAEPSAAAMARIAASEIAETDAASWEPDYGRLPEAQVVWEARHGRPLPTEAA
jgi:tRNA threonylcarbamoyladenosine biosynthesis protein TsaB